MQYKMISMDFDGTLLTSNKEITAETKEVILNFKNKNYIIVGVTARNLASVNSVCDINMFDYLILNNGTYLYDVARKDGTSINCLDKNDINSITEYFKDISNEIDYITLNKYYKLKKAKRDYRKFVVPITNINELKEKVVRINIFIKNIQEIDKYKKYINDNYDNIYAFEMKDTDNHSELKWLSLNPRGINKFETLKQLCLKLNITTDEVIFFGDSTNDLQVIGNVGLGVAMGNALQEVKEQAKEVTSSNDENGIAKLLEKLLK